MNKKLTVQKIKSLPTFKQKKYLKKKIYQPVKHKVSLILYTPAIYHKKIKET